MSPDGYKRGRLPSTNQSVYETQLKMKTSVFLVAILCFSVAIANPVEEEAPVTDRQADCISDILGDIQLDTENIGELGEDALETVRRLNEQRQRCEEMLGDPPTAVQERMHELCRLAWTATVAYELNRLRGQTNVIDGAITAVQECRSQNQEDQEE